MNVVKYGNDINTVPFGTFKAQELDLFFSICFKAKEKGVKEIIISFDELKSLSNYTNKHLPKFVKDLSSTYDKMLSLNIKIRHSELSFTKFNLFNKYTVDAEKRTVLIKVSDEFEYLLNNFIGNYTKFDLIEFVQLKSAYSKTVFRLLKQWESVKYKIFEVAEFRHLLGVPKTYSTSDFNKRVLKPVMTELKDCFFNLKIEKIKTKNKVSKIQFTWSNKTELIEPVEDEKNENEEAIIEISAQLDKVIEKAKHNRFLKNVLSEPNNIVILVRTFSEEVIIKALLKAYHEVTREIHSISYIIQIIKNDLIQPAKPIIVVQNSLFDTTPKEIVEEPQKIDITQEEFDKKYQKHLADIGEEETIFNLAAFRLNYNIIPDLPRFEPKQIDDSQLIGKNGKPLTGMALKMRLKKLKGE